MTVRVEDIPSTAGVRRSRARVLSATAFAGALLAFTLPFGTVSSCDGEEVRFTGAELASFSVQPDPNGDGTLDEEMERNGGVLALAVLLAAAFGLFGAIVSRRPRGGLYATLGLVAAQLLLAAILVTGTAGGAPGTGFGLALLALAVAGIVNLVGACRARRRAGRRAWSYALGPLCHRPLPDPERDRPAADRGRGRRLTMSARVNDVHSRLNETAVGEIVEVSSVEEVQAALARARDTGLPVSIAGGRHAMGGQQFCSNGVLLDTRPLSRVLSLDEERGLVEVEAGIQWPALIEALSGTPWAIRQKQTGADDFCIGGAVSANVHGRGLAFGPFVDDIEELVVVDPDGAVLRCSRHENADLFRLVCGGYGLFGVVCSATLRLDRRRKLERVVRLADAEELDGLFAERIADGYLYGDFQFEIDPGSPRFLQHGVFSCYRPVPDETPLEATTKLSAEDWSGLLHLAHTDKARAFELYAAHYLSTSGQVYLSDRHQLANYVPGYHWAGSSEMITELYVPRPLLADFLAAAAHELRALEADVVYGTVRLIERDDETALAWAREPWACVVLNLHVEHAPASVRNAAVAFRRLIDLALERGGSFYLTYHRWATQCQLLAAYPQLPAFLEAKLERDPDELLESDWYRWLRATLALEEAA